MFIVNGVSGSSLHCINFGSATDIGCGSGKIYFDDFELTPAELEQPVETLEFTETDAREAAEQETGVTAPAASFPWAAAAGGGACVLAALGVSIALLVKKRR